VAANGDGTISFSKTAGTLPSGVSLAANGTLSGTPAYGTAGSYPVTITATDAHSNTTTQSFTLTVSASGPTFTSTASTTFAENTGGSYTVTAHGDGTISFSKTAGTLPSGVTLGTSGTLSGTPAYGTAGSYTFTITATDANSNTATQSFTLTVTASGPTFTSAASTTFDQNTPGSFAVTASGDTPITYSEQGPLPSGVTLATNGTLSGTPGGTVGSYPITLTATDGHSATATQSFTLTVAPGPSTSVLVPTTGTAVRGTTTLDASASSAAGVHTVQYAITGGSYNKTVIGTATASIYGYYYSWNTTTVPDGSYSLQSLVTDNAGGSVFSTPITVLVDNDAPTTAVLVPTTGTGLKGTSTLDASASDDVSVASVKFAITGGSYNKTVIGTATASIYGYYYSWNTTAVPDGTYTLQSVATDVGGNTTYSTGITVYVDNVPPTTAVLVPANNASLKASTTLDASASDDVSVASVKFAITGGSYNKTVIGTATASIYGYYYSWNTTTVPDGTYTLQSVATDIGGNTTYSAAVTIKVSN
jgi:hypothetical protein